MEAFCGPFPLSGCALKDQRIISCLVVTALPSCLPSLLMIFRFYFIIFFQDEVY